MAYCVRCGVELAESEKKCPLCGTSVYHPDLPEPNGIPPYPPRRGERTEQPTRREGVLAILTMLFILPAAVSIISDLQINDSVTWSGFSALGLVLLYVIAVLPLWFRQPNPVIFVPVDFVAVGGYLLYICFATGGHWFLPFALPVTGGVMLIVTAAVTLVKYVRRGYLYIAGGVFLATGGLSVLVEFLLNRTFSVAASLYWSVYPLLACFAVGMMLIVIAICRPLRESLRKRFFL